MQPWEVSAVYVRPIFLFIQYGDPVYIGLESSVNVMQQDGVVYSRCVRTLGVIII